MGILMSSKKQKERIIQNEKTLSNIYVLLP